MGNDQIDNDFRNEEDKLDLEEPEIYRTTKLSRSISNFVLSGVCGGLGEYLNTEPNLFRIIFVLGVLLGGWGIALYIVLTLLIPLTPADEFTEEEIDIIKNAEVRTIIGTISILLGIYFIFEPLGIFYLLGDFHFKLHYLIFVVLISLGIYFIKAKEPILKAQENPAMEFTRSKSDKRFMGVCGGFANYLNIDPTLMRVIWVVSLFITAGISLLLYILFVLIVPFEKDPSANET